MTLILDEQSTGQLDAASGGPIASTFGENYSAARAAFLANDLSIARSEGIFEQLQGQKDRAAKLGFALGGEASVRADFTGGDPMGPGALELPSASEARKQEDYSARVSELNARLPEGEKPLLSYGELVGRAAKIAAEKRAQAAEIASRRGEGTNFGGFLGTLVGAFSDPVNIYASIASAPLAARSMLQAIVIEAGVNITSEALIQTKVVPWLIEQGVAPDQARRMAVQNVLMAGVFGAMFGVALRGASVSFGAAARAIRRGKFRRALEAGLDELDKKRADLPEEALTAIDAIREALDAERTAPTRSRSPEALAAHARNLAEVDTAIREGRAPRTTPPAHGDLPAIPSRANPVEAVGEALAASRAGEAASPVPADFKPGKAELAAARDVKRGVPAGKPPPSLTKFVRDSGGLDLNAPEAGELRAQDLGSGRLKLLRRPRGGGGQRSQRAAGHSFDDMALAAQEAGFFPDVKGDARVDIETFVQALIADASGARRFAGREGEAFRSASEALAEQARSLEEDLGIDVGALSDRELAFVLRQDPQALRVADLIRRVDDLGEAESLELARALDDEISRSVDEEMQAAIEAQAAAREGFDAELEIGPERLQELNTSRTARLADLEEIHGDALAARSEAQTGRGPAGQAGPGDQGQAGAAPLAVAARRADQAAQEAPGHRGAGAGKQAEGGQAPVGPEPAFLKSIDEIEALLAAAQRSDAENLLKALGTKERVKRFEQLDARRNSANTTVAGKASKQFDEEFGNLTAEQELLIFGSSADDLSLTIDELKEILEAKNFVEGFAPDDTNVGIGQEVAFAMKNSSKEEISRLLEDGTGPAETQVAVIFVEGGFREFRKRGLSNRQIDELLLDGLENIGFSRADAAEVLSGFSKRPEPRAQTATPQRGLLETDAAQPDPQQGAVQPDAARALGSPPDPSRIPKRDRAFIENVEAEAADIDGIAAGAEARLAEIDLEAVRTRAAEGDPAAGDLLAQLDDAKTREDSWSALLDCLGEGG